MDKQITMTRMYCQLLLAFLPVATLFSLPTLGQSYQKIHDKAILVDTHNDILSSSIQNGFDMEKDLTGKTASDLDRFKKGGVDVQVFSIFCDDRYGVGRAFARANQEID